MHGLRVALVVSAVTLLVAFYLGSEATFERMFGASMAALGGVTFWTGKLEVGTRLFWDAMATYEGLWVRILGAVVCVLGTAAAVSGAFACELLGSGGSCT